SGPALYALTTETGMPNLEENLRYATTPHPTLSRPGLSVYGVSDLGASGAQGLPFDPSDPNGRPALLRLELRGRARNDRSGDLAHRSTVDPRHSARRARGQERAL